MKNILCFLALSLLAAGMAPAETAFAATNAKKAAAKKAAEPPKEPDSPVANAAPAAGEAQAMDCGPTQHICKTGNRSRCIPNSQKCGPRKKKHQ